MKNRTFNVVITGIGGQGVLTAGAAIAHAAMAAGQDVKTAELHGLATRFGPLEMHVRFGKKVLSPLVSIGSADLIIGLERLETLRALDFSGRKTAVLMDPRSAVPTIMIIRKQKYPSEAEAIKTVKKLTKGKVASVQATEAVKKLGADPIAANIYLLGRASGLKMLPLKEKEILEGIRNVVPQSAFELNKRLFEAGLKG